LPDSGTLWPDADQERDAEQMRAALPIGTDIVVVDHYGLDATWERLVGKDAGRVVVIDDLADRSHVCDILVDQTWSGPDTSARYDERVPDGCRLLLGPRYALLESAYATMRRQITGPAEDEPRRLVVSFGGSDPSGETRKVLEAIEGIDLADLHIDVVLGAGSRDSEEELHDVTTRNNVSYHVDLPNLVGLLSEAELAVGAGGITTWERICLGVPSLVTSVAPNQMPVAVALQEAGVIVSMGDAAGTTPERYRARIRSALVDGLPVPPPLVDGWGARRVAFALLGLPLPPLQVRPATEMDAPAFLGVDRGSAGSEPAYLSGPSVWDARMTRLRSELEGSNSLPLVPVLDGVTVGAIHVQRERDRARASFLLDDAVSDLGLEADLTQLLRGMAWDLKSGRLVDLPTPTPERDLLPIEVIGHRS
jgi:UDP-2,4-diacetamido-2,4,6-trideoxy-beta-L-altropyranose hydrolase